MAVLKEHLQSKVIPGLTHPIMPGTVVVVPQQLFGQSTPCLSAIEDESVTWDASYNNYQRLWEVTATMKPTAPGLSFTERLMATKYLSWSVYDRTGSIVATGDDPLNQFC